MMVNPDILSELTHQITRCSSQSQTYISLDEDKYVLYFERWFHNSSEGMKEKHSRHHSTRVMSSRENWMAINLLIIVY